MNEERATKQAAGEPEATATEAPVEAPAAATAPTPARRPIHTPVAIRQVELPRSFRGFDESATRELLGQIADSFHTLINERDELRKRVGELEQDGGGTAGATQAPESVSSALLSATRVAEELLTDAHEEADRVKAGAKAEADRLVEEALQRAEELERQTQEQQAELETERDSLLSGAREEIEQLTSDAERRVVGLESEAARLRAAIGATHDRFAELTRTALEQLEALGSDAEASATSSASLGELVDDLRPGTPEQAERTP